MPFATCPAKPNTTVLGPPETGLGVTLTNGILPSNNSAWGNAITTVPFTLSGAPVSIPPSSTRSQYVTYIKQMNGETPPNPITSDIYLNTQGLITDSTLKQGTTLRVTGESVVFSLQFIAFHQGIWDSTTPQVSLFFSGHDAKNNLIYFHLCIPIEYTTNSDTNVNLFLNSWLNKKPVTSGMTVNTLLNTGIGDLKIQMLNYCLGSTPYSLALSSDKILLNGRKLPSWLASDPTCTGNQWSNGNTRYTLKTFSDFYTYAMNIKNGSTLNWPSATTTESYRILTSIFDTAVQKTVLPSYYKYPITSTDFIKPNLKIPKNQMKCYPLDVLKDIEADGSVTINTKDKKPVSTKAAQDAANGGITAVAVGPAELQAQSNTLVLVFVIVFIILGIVLVISVYNTVFPRESGATALAAAAAALPALLPPPPTIAATLKALTTIPAPLPNPPTLSAVTAGLPAPLPPPPTLSAPPPGGLPAALPAPPSPP